MPDELTSVGIGGMIIFIIIIIFSLYYLNIPEEEVEVGPFGKEADKIKEDIIQDLDEIGEGLGEIDEYVGT
jgi:regulator of protease activity HflC (stomatin/prohibitin superfamily)